MELKTKPEPEPVPPRKAFSGLRWPTTVALGLSVVAIISAALGSVIAHREVRDARAELDRLTDELDWSLEVHQTFHGGNEISPEVGTIQFLSRGYSIELEKVAYTPTGIELEGFVGNPMQLWVTQLTLDFWAYKPFYLRRDEFMKEGAENRSFFFPEQIGHAQSQTIQVLGPGRRAPFSVTVPNVAQTKEGFTLTVSFSGERYSYGH